MKVLGLQGWKVMLIDEKFDFEEFFEGFYENKNLLLLLSSCDSNGFTLDGRSVISIKTRIETS